MRRPLLPDFCNLGTWLRVLLAVNGMALAAAFARNPRSPVGELTEMSALLEPATIGSLVLLCAGRHALARLDARLAAAGVVVVALLVTAVFDVLLAPIGVDDGHSTGRSLLWAGLAATLLLAGFDLHARAHAPALSEARLLALTARIRPYFLFNSLNAVLGVIRSDPKRAEAALEELAELFRAPMKENRELVPLSEEIALTRQYLGLEHLRLGERLQVRWDMESCPSDARVPPLMLQPLVENAVYHGIEPLEGRGEIHIRLTGRKDRLTIEVSNPVGSSTALPAGSPMALANIRERLSLFFDLEATLLTEVRDGRHRVQIDLPLRPARAPAARRHLHCVERGSVLLVPVGDVLYFKAGQKYVTARTAEREYLLEESLVHLEQEFGDAFLRIHRNCIVAQSAVAGFAREHGGDDAHWTLLLRGVAERLPVSRRRWPHVKAMLESPAEMRGGQTATGQAAPISPDQPGAPRTDPPAGTTQ